MSVHTSNDILKNNDNSSKFEYHVSQFSDIEILRYKVHGFENLPLNHKLLIYYLSEAAIEGRDILYDQNCRYNIKVRKTIEAIYTNYTQERNSDDFLYLEIYLQQIWMGNGIHHHYSGDKFEPKFSYEFFCDALNQIDQKLLPISDNESIDDLISTLKNVIFDPLFFSKKSNHKNGEDSILTSANNYYENVTQFEVESFYNNLKKKDDKNPVSYGLNSKLVKEGNCIYEKTYQIGGLYGNVLEKIVFWLKKAIKVSQSDIQKKVINLLIDFYSSGDLKKYDDYSVTWLKDLNSTVDFINGFTETYTDPLGLKGSWEAFVNFKNDEATKRTQIVSQNAQWFEDNSPIDKCFKKEKVTGISAKVVTAAMLGGDCYPATPIGINLPNSNWIRRDHGSKSVTIENISEAYDEIAFGNGFADEFMWSDIERELVHKYGSMTSNLHTDLHECLGHGSGKLLDNVDPDNLKIYGATIEEARADLFGLYYLGDPKMIELGLLPDENAFKAEYYKFMLNGLLTQLARIEPGKSLEEAHMRNRQLIARWVFENGNLENTIELTNKKGKTFLLIHDYKKLRQLFANLLTEVQRIKSTGDYDAAKELVEKYGIEIDINLHEEILHRYRQLKISPYKGFVNPFYQLLQDNKGNILDVSISYDEDFIEQNLRYSKKYSLL